MNMIEEQQAVYILNRRAYQESSLLVDAFSLNFGRFSLVAKGAMRKGNAWSAALQPFQPLLISWSGRSSLKTLRSVDVPSGPLTLSSSFLFSAYYLNELVLKLLPENDRNESVFAAYVSCLSRLSAQQDIQQSLRTFEFILLGALGLLPDFEYDIDGKPIDSDKYYKLLMQQGFLAVDDVGQKKEYYQLSGRVISLVGHQSIESFGDWSKDDYGEAKRLMRCLVDDALGGQTIKSRELFRPVKYKG